MPLRHDMTSAPHSSSPTWAELPALPLSATAVTTTNWVTLKPSWLQLTSDYPGTVQRGLLQRAQQVQTGINASAVLLVCAFSRRSAVAAHCSKQTYRRLDSHIAEVHVARGSGSQLEHHISDVSHSPASDLHAIG